MPPSQALDAETLTAVALPAAFTAAGLALGLLLQHLLLPRGARSRSWVGDILAAVLRGPVALWSTVGGLYLASALLTLEARLAATLQRVLLVLAILSVTWSVARVVGAVVAHYARQVNGRLASATLLVHVARLVVLALGVLVILQTLGVSITPLLTALGVGGLAVGLALQDTLANFFAGIHILSSRQVRPGDYVQLDSGEEGYIQDVTWRYTTIQQLSNNITVVPNAKLASSVLTNYYLPGTELAVLVPVSVAYESELSQVEAVTVDVARGVMQDVTGGVPSFEPFVRYNAFAESGVAFTVILRGREIVDQHLIRHEFIKRLHERFRAERIEIPYPVRTVHLRGSAPAGPAAG